MKQPKRPLNVTVDVEQPSTIELTLHETVRLDRVRETARGVVAEQHDLIAPGTHTLALAPGRFMFKTMSDAQLRVVQGGVKARTLNDGKDDDPPRAPHVSEQPDPPRRGDAIPGKAPTFTIIR